MKNGQYLICIVIAGLLVLSAIPTYSEKPISLTNKKLTTKIDYSPIHQPVPIRNRGNVLISADNPADNDTHPKLIQNNNGTFVVVYEKTQGNSSVTIPVVYSEDYGETWTIYHIFDSLDFPEGTGVLASPDIKYVPGADEFFLEMVDPFAPVYNQETVWIPGDIAHNDNDTVWGISGQGNENYSECAVTYVGEWVVGLEIDDGKGPHTPGLGFFHLNKTAGVIEFPNDINSNWASGFYFDGQSILVTAPAFKPEMATGTDRMYMVMQTNTGQGSKISYKATVTDLDPSSDTFLFTGGGGPGGMDKYADIECWPWQMYLANGTDPDISASGNNVCVVYTQNGDVKCSYSFDDGGNFSVSTIATNAGYPAVFISGTDVYCAYVKDGNVYRIASHDGGMTWGAPERMNTVNGTVAEEPGTVDIYGLGVVWTDTRNGVKDIYFDVLTQHFLFYEGWNLMGWPFVSSMTAELLGGEIPGCTIVVRFIPLTQTFTTHIVGTPWDDFPIENGVGYFIYVTHNTTFMATGRTWVTTVVPYYPAWNLKHWPYDYNITAENLGILYNATIVSIFDAESQMFKSHIVGIPWDNFWIERCDCYFIHII